jgi:hypothetical protein
MKQSTFILVLSLFLSVVSFAQTTHVGGRLGFSSFSSSTGLQLGVTGDYAIRHDFAVGTEVNFNTQTGTPIEWANSVKYFIDMPNANFKPYADGGFNIWFVNGGPYFGLRFGGGVLFPFMQNLSIPADIQMGPVFSNGTSTFYFTMTSGLRYTLP